MGFANFHFNKDFARSVQKGIHQHEREVHTTYYAANFCAQMSQGSETK